MPLAGFICPKTQKNTPFKECFVCEKPCHPLPFILSLAEERDHDPDVYHVTEILDPPKVVYLKRTNDYYRTPESLVYVTFGRGFHSVFEESKSKLKEIGRADEYLLEDANAFKVKVGKVWLSGRPDLYIPKQLALWDFKTGKYYYEVQKLLGGNLDESKHPMQLNIYRTYRYPEAKSLTLEMFIKDYRREMASSGVLPVMSIPVPLFPVGRVRTVVEGTLIYLEAVRKNPDSVRDCLPNELWISKGVPIRCTEYCDVSEFCVQYQAYKERQGEKNDSPKMSRRSSRGRV